MSQFPGDARLGGGYVEIKVVGDKEAAQKAQAATEAVGASVEGAQERVDASTKAASGSLKSLNKSFDATAGAVLRLIGKIGLLVGWFKAFYEAGKKVRAILIDIQETMDNRLQQSLDRVTSTDINERLREVNAELLQMQTTLDNFQQAGALKQALLAVIDTENIAAAEANIEQIRRLRDELLAARQNEIRETQRQIALAVEEEARLKVKVDLLQQVVDARQQDLKAQRQIAEQAFKDTTEFDEKVVQSREQMEDRLHKVRLRHIEDEFKVRGQLQAEEDAAREERRRERERRDRERFAEQKEEQASLARAMEQAMRRATEELNSKLNTTVTSLNQIGARLQQFAGRRF